MDDEQLYDVVVIVAGVSKDDDGNAYATSKVYKFDVEAQSLDMFITKCAEFSIHGDRLVAKEET